MVFGYFQQHDLMVLFPSLLLLIASIIFYVNNKYSLAIILLILAALGLRIFMAHLDPFLWDWDERYHALVAKNFVHHPLKPTLYDNPVLPFDYTSWANNHVWMHKQPLALWQMALSFLMFGINQFTARFPLIIEGTLLVLVIYRSATLLVNKKAGYLAALIYATNFYALNFVSGKEATDHVDYALVFYISLSLWAWLEYSKSFKNKWWILAGVFSGLAVLSKWAIGLLLFPAWGITILADSNTRFTIRHWLNLLKSFMISILIFLPWLWYSMAHYPAETNYELHYNSSHLLKEVDGRGETVWYYLEQLAHNYNPLVPYIIGFALLFCWRYIKNKHQRIFLFSCLVIPYFVFSIIAATKMPAYCYIAVLPVLISLGCLAWYLEQRLLAGKIPFRKWILAAFLIILAITSIDLPGIAKIHTGLDPENVYRENKVRFTDRFREIGASLPKNTIVFGTPKWWEIEMMFYTGNTCYPGLPTANQIKDMKYRGYKVAVLTTEPLPDYILNDADILKIKFL
jgi:4-amino-4-deoxy-L-arabinose transferase-like glycosyltransferase